MKALPLLLLFFWQAAAPSNTAERAYFLYQRSIVPTAPGLNCAVLDADVFAHSGASLKDLRLFPQTAQAREIPYAVTLSEPIQPDAEPARVLNLGLRNGVLSFDLAMPRRPYTDVVLSLAGQDYIASATVTGIDATGESGASNPGGTRLGEFTLFDLTSQHLSRSSTLPLQESSFPFLHIDLIASAAPGTRRFDPNPQMVLGASVPPSREAQSVYTLASETRTLTQRGRQTVARFPLPERVPVERVTFVLSPQFRGNFTRDVAISDHPADTTNAAGETVSGSIFRVHLAQSGREIDQQRLSIPATLGSNLQSAAEVEITVDNGDDQPLPIAAVLLEMRQRRLCFDAPSTAPLTLFYGEPTLPSPIYDFARTVSLTNQIPVARVGPEQKNPVYTPRPDTRAFTERHPEVIWVAFLGVVCILAVVAIRSSRHLPR